MLVGWRFCFPVLLALMIPAKGTAQVFWSHDFGSPGGYRVTKGTEHSDGSRNHFGRAYHNNGNPNLVGVADTLSLDVDGVSLTGSTNDHYLLARDLDQVPGSSSATMTILFENIDISGQDNIALEVSLAEDDAASGEDWDHDDYVHFDHTIDGNSTWTPTLWVENDGSHFNSTPFIDADHDGTGEGPALTDTFQTFQGLITDTGTTLDLRVTFRLNSDEEDIAIDRLALISQPSSHTLSIAGLTPNGNFSTDCSAGDSVQVAFITSGTFDSSNVFSAQLSDSTGAFTSPLTIGDLPRSGHSPSDTIPAVIPPGTQGDHFRIRVVASTPAVTGPDNGTDLPVSGPSLPAGEVLVNEFSNGPEGKQEYLELLVTGNSCSHTDLRHVILDDNNGKFGSNGISKGHVRLSNAPQWNCFPTGNTILLYNDQDPNPALPPDDPTDSNDDSTYVIPADSDLLESCSSLPDASPSDKSYGPCLYASGGSWSMFGWRNGGDAVQVRDQQGNYMHGISYGDLKPAGPDSIHLSTNGGGRVVQFDHQVDNDPTKAGNFASAPVASAESPGQPNNTANKTFIRSLGCEALPVEWLAFEAQPEQGEVHLEWAVVTGPERSAFEVERSRDGKTFIPLATIPSTGPGYQPVSYQYVDSHPWPQVSYYRIRRTDPDGKVFSSPVRAVQMKTASRELALLKAHPQGNLLQVHYRTGRAKHATLQLMDVWGRILYEAELSSDQGVHPVPMGTKARGIFLIRLQNDQERVLRKLIR